MLFTALMLAQSGSVLAGMTDAQFCEVFQRNVAQVPAQESAPFSIARPNADCSARRIRATITIAASGDQFTGLHEAFVANARAGVCNLSDPTMAAFHDRGWRYAYRFLAQDGETVNVTLNC